MERLRELFDAFDTDGGGAISAEELGAALRKMGAEPSNEELEDLVRSCDADGNGEISFHEFANVLMHNASTESYPGGDGQPAGSHHRHMDSIKEIAAAFEQYRVSSTKEYRQTGDQSMQSHANMEKRRELRTNPTILRALKTYWGMLSAGASSIPKEKVTEFQLRLCKALFDDEDWDLGFAKQIVEEDWVREMGDKTSMSEQ